MEYLVYRSRALVAPDSGACRDIVEVSQVNNANLGLTGFLHAESGQFIQYLEGAPEPLWSLYERLFEDTRHTDLVLLGHGELSKPRFEDWSMGYSDINVMSFSDFLKQVSFKNWADEAQSREAIYFLMAASMRIDLGIVEQPASAWR